MQKSPDAFRTISEVAAWLDTPAHVLRFWESRFPEVAPVKRAGGRRYYRPEDMRLLGGIKHLLHTEGHTIKSVQERLQKGGVEAVAAFSPSLDQPAAPKPKPVEGDPHSVVPAQAELFDAGAPGDKPAPVTTPAATVEETVQVPPQAAAPAPEGPSDLDDELPPIGFFFDDSDDAAPAADQSGTFADARAETPEEQEEPEPVAETAAPDPVPVAQIPPLDLTLPPPLPGVTHNLRAMLPSAVTAAQKTGFRTCAQRLSALSIAAE